MLFPIRDSIPARLKPVVNIGLIVVCCLVFVYQIFLGERIEAFIMATAFIPARLFDSVPVGAMPLPDYGLVGNLITMVASMFLHGGWLHIIGNMWFLYVFGDNVESAFGHGRYLLFYIAGGIAATLTHAVTDTTSVIPTVGASGAIAAVLGAYIVLYPRSRIHTLVFLGFFLTVTELPAMVMLGFWFALQFFEGLLSMAARPGVSGVAWFAHIGGFVFGVGVAWLMKASGRFRQTDPRYQIWYRH